MNTNFGPPNQRYNTVKYKGYDKENREHVSSGFQILEECLKGTSVSLNKDFYCPSRTES